MVLVIFPFPKDLRDAIATAYQILCQEYNAATDVAVCSSSTAEDLPDASFAGQQEGDLNIVGIDTISLNPDSVLQTMLAVAKCETQGVCVIYDGTNAQGGWRLNLLQQFNQKFNQKFNLAIASPVLWMGWYLHQQIFALKCVSVAASSPVLDPIISIKFRT